MPRLTFGTIFGLLMHSEDLSSNIASESTI